MPCVVVTLAVLSSGANHSLVINETDLLLCGSAFCPAQIVKGAEEAAQEYLEEEEEEAWQLEANLTSLLEPNSSSSSSNITSLEAVELVNFSTPMERIYLLAGIYLGCSICAALIIALFVDPIGRYIGQGRKLHEIV